MPVIEVTDPVAFRDHLQKSQENGQLVVVDYFATWCGPCKFIAPVMEKMSDEMNHIKFLKVDVDEQADLAAEANISSMPTFGFWINGKLVTKVEGANPRSVEDKCTMYGNPLAFTKPDTEVQNAIKSIINDLKCSTHEPQHQIDSCERLFKICDDEPTVIFIVANNGLNALMSCMKNYPDNVDIQRHICNTFLKFQFNDGFFQSGCIEAVIVIMKMHSSSSDFQVVACHALSLMALHESNSSQIVKVGGIKLIINAMLNHLTVQDVQIWSCRALANLAEAADEGEVIEAGGIKQIICTMQYYQTVPDVQEAACYALRHLASDGPSAVSIVQFGGIEAVVKTMQSCLDVTTVLTCACQVLVALGAEPENRVDMEKAGCIEMIISIMRRHLNNSDVQQNACAAMGYIVFENECNETKFCDVNGIEVVLNGMRQHQDDRHYLTMACKLLFELAVMDSAKNIVMAGGTEVLKEYLNRCVTPDGFADFTDVSKPLLMIGGLDVYLEFMKRHVDNMTAEQVHLCLASLCGCASMGGLQDIITAAHIEVIINSINKHLDDAQVQECACDLFRFTVVESNVQLVVDAGAVETIINGMKHHLLVESLQYEACVVLRTLCTSVKTADDEEVDSVLPNRIAAAGGIEAIIKAMQQYPDKLPVQQHAQFALFQVLNDNTPNQLKAVELGGVETIVKAMQRFLDIEKLQTLACICLNMLFENESLKQDMVDNCKAETVVALINAMQRHTNMDDLVSCVYRTLTTIALTNETIIGDADGIEAIVMCMKQHRDNAELLDLACVTLSFLSGTVSNQTKIESSGAIDMVIECMRSYEDSLDFQCSGLNTLFNFVDESIPNRLKIGEVGGVEVVMRAMNTFPDNAEVQKEGNLVLAKLNEPDSMLTCE